MCSLNLPSRKAEPVHKIDTVAWNKCIPNDIEQYQYSVASNLKRILSIDSCKCDPDFVNKILISAFRHAEKYLPTSKFNHKAKPYWDKEVKEKHTEARRQRRIWIQEGRPRCQDSFSFLEYKRAKGRFQNSQRRKKYEHENRTIDDLNQAAEIDYKPFWNLLRKRKGGNTKDSCKELRVDDVTYTNENAVKGFKKHFEKVFKDNDCSKYTELSKIKELNQLVKATPGNDMKGLTNDFTTEEIQEAIKTLKKRKSPGCDNSLNEHFNL